MDTKILVVGSEGLVGSRFVELSEHKNKFHVPRRVEFDMTDATEVNAIFKSYNFTTVVNFAAFTEVDEAELERENKNGPCWVTNVEGLANIAQAIANNGNKTHLIHISTDMVFPGDNKDKGPYEESHIPEKDLDRLTWYGYTKAEGERTLSNILGEEAAILRLAYPVAAKFEAKLDFFGKPLSLFDKGKRFTAFSDQQVSISFLDEVVAALDKIITGRRLGTFHASSRDTSTPFELVGYLLEKVRDVKGKVKPQKLDDFINSVKAPIYRYPKYGGLKVEETEKTLGLKFRTCKEIIDELVAGGLA